MNIPICVITHIGIFTFIWKKASHENITEFKSHLDKNSYPLNCQMILITVMMYIVNLYNIVKILIIYVVLVLIIV